LKFISESSFSGLIILVTPALLGLDFLIPDLKRHCRNHWNPLELLVQSHESDSH